MHSYYPHVADKEPEVGVKYFKILKKAVDLDLKSRWWAPAAARSHLSTLFSIHLGAGFMGNRALGQNLIC